MNIEFIKVDEICAETQARRKCCIGLHNFKHNVVFTFAMIKRYNLLFT